MKQKSIFESRVKKLKEELDDEGLRGAMIVPGPNMRYFTGVDSHLLERPFLLLVPTKGEPHLVAPAIEAGPYRECSLALKIHPWTDSEGSGGAVGEAVEAVGMKGRWGVEGKVPFLFLSKVLKKASPKLRDAEPILQGLREDKDQAEVELLRKSGEILSRSFAEFPGLIREGMTELELARAATDTIYAKGATKVEDMLVQSGPKAADPHGLPTAKKVGRGESIIIDVGSVYQGYYADITRTFCIGPSPEVERVYERVLEAETAGIGRASSGARVGEVDKAARSVLERAGLGKYFIHRTGHGLGLEVHEAPYIVEGGKEKLAPNMCFTVEPGVYLRGKLGVRIEDDVLMVGKKGAAITDAPKSFGWWK